MNRSLQRRLRPLSDSRSGRRLVVELAAAALARFVLNTARRFTYPFGPALARGLDVPLTRITSLVALNQGVGLLSPFMGTLADRWGPRVMMLIELAWAGSSLIGIPTVGWLIGRFGWHSPFLALGLLAASSVMLLAMLLPRVPVSRDSAPRSVPAGQGWRLLVRRRPALGGLGYSFCFA